MPAFNQSHFKQVYRTAYFNPYGSADVANHSDAWSAVSYDEAEYLQAEITAGNITGTVDLTSASLESGVVFIQYYDGAILQGKATSNDGTPYAGIYVTVVDEYGIPHQVVKTASDGSYSVDLPFGNISVVYSTGTLTKSTLIATEISRVNYTVSYAQAQRLAPFNADGNITLPGSSVSGRVYWDLDGSGTYSTGDQYIAGATVTLQNNATGFKAETTSDTNGAYSLVGLAGNGNYLYATYNDHQFGGQTFNMVAYGSLTKAIVAKPASIDGTLTFSNGDPAAGVALSLTDKATGTVTNATSGTGGKFLFDRLLPGEYTLTAVNAELSVGVQTYNLTAGAVLTPTLSLYSATQVSGTVRIGSEPRANVAVGFISSTKEAFATTDSSGHYNITLAQGNYTVYALTVKDGVDYVAMMMLNADVNSITQNLSLSAGSVVTGTVTTDGSTAASGATVVYTSTGDGAFLNTTTNSSGGYRLVLPAANYFVYAQGSSKAYWSTATITGSTNIDLGLQDSVSIAGKAYYDVNGNSVVDSGEAIANAVLKVQSTSSSNQAVYFLTSSTGSFNITLPKGNGYTITATKDGYAPWSQTYDPLNNYVTVNIPLVANNRTVTGAVTVPALGSPSDITVNFVPSGTAGTAASVVTNATGGYSLDLKPGTYNVVIDQNVSADDSSKYQYTGSLTVSVGRDPADMTINATERVKVDGTVAMPLGASGSIQFIGPENKILNDVSSAFPLYLVPGDYSVYVDVTSGGKHYVNLSAQTIAAGSALTITPLEANTLTGQLQYDGSDLKVPATITISSGEANYTLSANNQGVFVAHLVNGTYTVDAEYHTQASDDGATRYVVYTASQEVTLNGDNSTNIVLTRRPDNGTLSGTITGAASEASWTFTALDGVGIDATMDHGTGPYSISLAPGMYSVYGIDNATVPNVYMGVVTVAANKGTTANLNLTAGIAVTGTVSYSGTPRNGATVVFSNNAQRTVTTSGSGNYVAYLTKGLYNCLGHLGGTGEWGQRDLCALLRPELWPRRSPGTSIWCAS